MMDLTSSCPGRPSLSYCNHYISTLDQQASLINFILFTTLHHFIQRSQLQQNNNNKYNSSSSNNNINNQATAIQHSSRHP